MFDDYRSAWKAAKALRTPSYVDPLNRSEFFVHYDGSSELHFADHAGCLARVKANQTFHMSTRAWSDIGYNGLVCQHGRAIEGRGIDYSGAHCPDHNTSGYGFQFMVGGDQQPTAAAKARMRRLYDDACDHSKRTLAKRGHRDGFATACPGDGIYAWVKAGMPAATEEDEVTPQDIKALADEVLNRPVRDLAGNEVTVGAAIGFTLRNSISAARDAAAARGLAEASAKAGRPLSAEETAEAVRAALSGAYNVTLTPKES